MNAGKFYKGVRLLVTSALLMAAAPALGMTVYLGQVVGFEKDSGIYRVVGARLLNVTEVSLELENVRSGETKSVTVQRAGDLSNVPGLEIISTGPKSLPLLY